MTISSIYPSVSENSEMLNLLQMDASIRNGASFHEPTAESSDQVERPAVYNVHHYSHLYIYSHRSSSMAFYAESQCFRPRFFRFFAWRYKPVLQVSGTGTAFKEAVSFELAEEELWDAPGPVDPTFSAICRGLFCIENK